MRNRFKGGEHNVISDDSGQKFKSSEMRYTWDGKLVHKDEWEPKQPQLTIKGRKERIAIPNVRTQSDDPELLNPPITPSQMI